MRTCRNPLKAYSTKVELTQWGIEFDELIFLPSLQAKGETCADHEVTRRFDNLDECIVDVPESVLVCRLRNGEYFDYEQRRWISIRN